MRASQSRKTIFEIYEKYDRRLTVISYTRDNTRIMSYMNYGFHDAMLLVAKRLSMGVTVRIYIDLPNHMASLPLLGDIHTKYIFSPDEVF